MNIRRPQSSGKHRQRGYALLVVLFFVSLVLISAMVVAPNILTEGRREKEKEMIWRGKQYTRGVKLYYRKFAHFPTSLDDLTKPKIGSIRFMRQAYKDPMNKEDGAWRLIYVGPTGQLIGSLKPPQQNLQLPGASGIGTPASALNGQANPAQPGAPGGAFGGAFGQQGIGGQPSTTGTPVSTATSGANQPSTTGTPVSADQGSSGSGDQAIPSGDTPTIVGGNIIGVGSKINKSSIIIYDKAKNYRLFEFIWDPSKDNVLGGQPGLQTGTGLGQIPGQPIGIGQPAGQTPFGQQPGLNPGNSPQNPQQNPQQPPPQNPQQ